MVSLLNSLEIVFYNYFKDMCWTCFSLFSEGWIRYVRNHKSGIQKVLIKNSMILCSINSGWNIFWTILFDFNILGASWLLHGWLTSSSQEVSMLYRWHPTRTVPSFVKTVPTFVLVSGWIVETGENYWISTFANKWCK